MCGIAGIYVKPKYINRVPVNLLLNELLLGIESRGKDATGYFSVTEGGNSHLEKGAVSATAFLRERTPVPGDTRMVLLHTRLATQGGPEHNENNHPVNFGRAFVTHNGVITNDGRVFRDLNKSRNAEVDSIAIAALIDESGVEDIDALKEGLEKLYGSFAIAAVIPDENAKRLILAKGSTSPLVVLEHEKCFIWASEKKAIDDAWGKVIGTPPKHTKFTWAQPGDIFVIENNLLRKEHFNANVGTGWTGGYSNYGEWEEREWTCYPSSGYCDFDCGNCQNTKCLCYKGSAKHPKRIRDSRPDSLRNKKGKRTTVSKGSTRNLDYAECWGCNEWVMFDDMTQIDLRNVNLGQKFVCPSCADDWENDADSFGTNDHVDINNYEVVASRENQIHRRACEETAFELGTTVAFVDWIMFRCSSEDLEADELLTNLRKDIETEYELALAIARDAAAA